MRANSIQSTDQLRASLLELIDVCPVTQCNPRDCPLFALRNMNIDQRQRWFEALHRTDLEYLAGYHYVCMNLQLRARATRTRQPASGGPTPLPH
jgi:hypothetical protein